jgi:hypothetical protein
MSLAVSLASHTVSATVSLQESFFIAHERFCGATVSVANTVQNYLRSRKWRFSGSVWRSIVSFASSSSAMEVEQEIVSGVSALLGYYEALIGGCVPTFRDNVSVASSKCLGLLYG